MAVSLTALELMVGVATAAIVVLPATIETTEVPFNTIWLLTEEITDDVALMLSADKQFWD